MTPEQREARRADVEALMKRCQIGVGGRDALDAAHSIMAECYGTLGRQQAEIDRLHALLIECEKWVHAGGDLFRSVRLALHSDGGIGAPNGEKLRACVCGAEDWQFVQTHDHAGFRQSEYACRSCDGSIFVKDLY